MSLRVATLAITTLSLGLASTAQAADYEQGLQLKQQQKLDAAATEFRALIAQNPGDLKSLEQLAIVESWQGHYDASIALWKQLVQAQPENAYFQVGLARVLYWQGRHADALATLDQAAALQAESFDARVLRGDVLMALGRTQQAHTVYEQARATPEGAQDATLAAKLQRAQPLPRWRLDAGAIADRYTALRGHEGSQYAQLGYTFNPQLSGYLHYDRFNYFDALDHGLAAGAYWAPSKHWLLQAEAGINVDDENFRPSRYFSGQLEWLPDAWLQPTLGLRLSSYEQGDVETLTPGLRLFPKGPLTLELRHAISDNTDGSYTGVSSLRANTTLGRFSPYAMYVKGEEALPPLPEAKIEVAGAGVVVAIDARWSVRFDYSYEDRKGVYTHQAYGVGVGLRF